MPWGRAGAQDLSWPPFPAIPLPDPNLLADEGREGLHLQGGAHDDEEVHLQEVLWRGGR